MNTTQFLNDGRGSMDDKFWSIEVSVNAEVVLSIGDDWLSGADEETLYKHRAIIINAAKHVLAFMGDGLYEEDYADGETH